MGKLLNVCQKELNGGFLMYTINESSTAISWLRTCRCIARHKTCQHITLETKKLAPVEIENVP
jgi:hypothetical protein